MERLIKDEKEAIEAIRSNMPTSGFQMLRESICMAIEALEKLSQKKPDYEGDGYTDGELVYDTWICPSCGTEYEVDHDEYKHCPECGQAIDWSEGD